MQADILALGRRPGDDQGLEPHKTPNDESFARGDASVASGGGGGGVLDVSAVSDVSALEEDLGAEQARRRKVEALLSRETDARQR